MCPICGGGTCNSIGNALVAVGVPFLAVFFWKCKNSFKKLREKLLK